MNPALSSCSAFALVSWARVAVGLAFAAAAFASGQSESSESLLDRFENPPEEAKPWTFWYWLQGAVSSEGVDADVEAMAKAGLGGAYLMPLIAPDEEPFWSPPVRILSDEYWTLVGRAVRDADKAGLSLGIHIGPGFSLAGGPWITPEFAMQRVVWSETTVDSESAASVTLSQPETNGGYYRDIAVFAFPSQGDAIAGAERFQPKIAATFESDFSGLTAVAGGPTVKLYGAGSITYDYSRPVTVNSLRVVPATRSFEALRLLVEASDDGVDFRVVRQLTPPRHGWQDEDFGFTFALPPTRARYFRFVYDPEGGEPGAEDLDRAKWKPSLKVKTLALSSVPLINQFEGKSAAVWRVADWTSEKDVPTANAIPRSQILDLSDRLGANGALRWTPPSGTWTVLRFGHTATGSTNYTGGAGEGLEADRFNADAIKLQFDKWFGETARRVGQDLFSRVVTTLHSDSWEAGSQNWGATFRTDFEQRRGYDPVPFLPAMAGFVVESSETSERFLYDLRQTVAELVDERYFGTLRDLAHQRGCQFSSESTAPTMVSDNLRHNGLVDIPMGEFWLRSPTHDKPMDMRDAVSSAHIYGKPIVQAEAFTELRVAWDEAPHNLRTLGDLHFALGVNRFVFHVFMQSPWIDRFPGVTLNGVGLFFQRGQTWWTQGRAWIDYITRSQALLQAGRPVTDVAVFSGEELPSRALTPDRLVGTLPGLIGEKRVAAEAQRLADSGNPMRHIPKGVTSTANATDLLDWDDPLHGYTYDSVNLETLESARVEGGRLVLASGVRYAVLVVPGQRRLNPEGGTRMSTAFARCLLRLAEAGLPIIIESVPTQVWGNSDEAASLERIVGALKNVSNVHIGAWEDDSLASVGIEPDLILREKDGEAAEDLAWIHGATDDEEYYFVSNQEALARSITVSLRAEGAQPEIWDAVTGKRFRVKNVDSRERRTGFDLEFAPNQSLFIVLPQGASEVEFASKIERSVSLNGHWTLRFPGHETVALSGDALPSWIELEDAELQHFSGTASYERTIEIDSDEASRHLVLSLCKVADIAEVFVDDVSQGVVWTAPWQLNLAGKLTVGKHDLRIEVTNTWANQLIADHDRPDGEKRLWTNAPYRLDGERLLQAGLLGPVELMVEEGN